MKIPTSRSVDAVAGDPRHAQTDAPALRALRYARDDIYEATIAAGYSFDQGRITALKAMRSAEQQLEAARTALVQQLRASGTPWSAIGAAIGISKQAAQQRYGGPPRPRPLVDVL